MPVNAYSRTSFLNSIIMLKITYNSENKQKLQLTVVSQNTCRVHISSCFYLYFLKSHLNQQGSPLFSKLDKYHSSVTFYTLSILKIFKLIKKMRSNIVSTCMPSTTLPEFNIEPHPPLLTPTHTFFMVAPESSSVIFFIKMLTCPTIYDLVGSRPLVLGQRLLP